MVSLVVALEDRVLWARSHGDASEAGRGWEVQEHLSGKGFEAVAAHPDRPDRVMVGTFDEGIYRTSDGGDSWGRVGEDTIDEHVTALAVDPSAPDRVYAGTEPSRVYTTGDGGETWTHLDGLGDLPSADSWAFPPRPSTHHVRWIEVDPTDPENLYVAIEAGALVRSFDGGDTWEDRVPSGRWDTHSMTTHPDAPGRAWCAAGDGYAETENGGETWTSPDAGLDHSYCWSVAVDVADPERVVLSAATGPRAAHTSRSAESYVYRRVGGADARWERAGEGLPHGQGMLRPVLDSGSDPGEVYLASNRGLWRSETMGEEWTELPLDWPEAVADQTVRGLRVLP